MTARILIIDDDEGYRQALSRHLARAGHEPTGVSTGAEARERCAVLAPDVVVIDQELPDTNGLALLDVLKGELKGVTFVIATAFPDVDFAVDAMRRGAFDYFAKGADSREGMIRIERAAEVSLLRRRVEESQGLSALRAEGLLIGESPAMDKLRLRLAALAASHDTTALIAGETGVGKGLIARAIYSASGRAHQPFVTLDCTTIPATLVESELFGHERGAFSGATSAKPGRVEAAGQGTLFLDEIGELELPVQAKLLRLLEEREYTRVGSSRPRRLEARIITATNRDLARAVDEGRFRADLRFRLEVFVLEVPPLRERGEDALLIAEHYIGERSRALGRNPPRLHSSVQSALFAYPFPGNVRELRNMVEQALLLATDDELTLEEFPVLARFRAGWQPPSATRPSVRPPPSSFLPAPAPLPRTSGVPRGASSSPGVDLRFSGTAPALGNPSGAAPSGSSMVSLPNIRAKYAGQERQRLVEALEVHGGNVSKAARQLGLSRFQLLRRLSKYGLR